tara:strand:+ start:11293 stop:13191 length:1899 start_codon:yes stop_codon:yes gene_type:complete
MANRPYYGKWTGKTELSYNGGTRTAISGGDYKEVITKEVELNNADGFYELFNINTEITGGYKALAANTYRDFNALMIENMSEGAIELIYHTGSWTAGSGDSYDAALYLTTYVPAGGHTFIENPRIVGYGAATSSMSGVSANTTSFDPTHIVDSGIYLNGASLTAAYTSTTMTVNDTDGLMPGDIIVFSPFTDGDINDSSGAHTFEVVRIINIVNSTQATIERGLYGTTPCAHDHSGVKTKKLYFWGINEHCEPAFLARNDYTVVASTATDTGGAMATLTTAAGNFLDAGFQPGMWLSFSPNGVAYNARLSLITEVTATTITFHRWSGGTAFAHGGNYAFAAGFWCGTDGHGRYKSNGLFGANFRSTDHIQGLVPGGQYCDFPVPVEQRLGMKNLTSRDKSGLTASTQYEFTLNLDGQREHIAFTTDANNLNFGGSNGILSKIQTAINDKVKDGNLYRNVSVTLENGDIVFRSLIGGGSWNGNLTNRGTDHTNRTGASQVDLQDYSSGNQFMGSGRIPGSPLPATSNDFPDTEKLHPKTGEVYNDVSNMLIDRGDGTLRRQKGGSGTINYESGAVDLKGLPAWSQVQSYYISESAHCGQLDTDTSNSCNGIKKVEARSVSPIANALVRVTLLA